MENVRQHTVPQCYLKNFAYDTSKKRNIFRFDKVNQLESSAKIRDVSVANRFYDIPKEIIPSEDKNFDLLVADRELQRVETILGVVLKKIAELHIPQAVDEETVTKLAYCIAVQFLRSQDARKSIVQIWSNAHQNLIDDITALNFPNDFHLRPKFQLDEQYQSFLHATFMLSPTAQRKLTETLLNHIWVFGVPHKKTPIYTSDNPLVRRNLTPEPIPNPTKPKMNADGTMTIGMVSSSLLPGFQEKGIEIFFPLNANLLLLLKERTAFPEYEMLHGRVVQIDTREVETNNRLQVEQSVRQIYCQSQDFDLAREICVEKPEMCDVERPRNKVESGMDRPTTSENR